MAQANRLKPTVKYRTSFTMFPRYEWVVEYPGKKYMWFSTWIIAVNFALNVYRNPDALMKDEL